MSNFDDYLNAPVQSPGVPPPGQSAVAAAQPGSFDEYLGNSTGVPRGTPPTGPITPQQAQQAALQYMTPQERAESQSLWSDVTGAGQAIGNLAQKGWLGRQAASIGQQVVAGADAATSLAGLVGNRFGLVSDADVDTMMRAAQAEQQGYEQARQQAMPATMESLITGQKPKPGIDWTGLATDVVMGGPLQGGIEKAITSIPTGALERAVPALSTDLSKWWAGRMAQNALTGGATAAATSQQSSAPVGTQIGLGAAAGAVLPPIVNRIMGAASAPIVRALGSNAAPVSAGVEAQAASQDIQNASNSVLDAIQTGPSGETTIDKGALPASVQALFNNPKFTQLTPEQQARMLRYEALGINSYSTSDVTRSAADQMAERNLANNANLGTAFRQADQTKNTQLLGAADPQKITGQAPLADAHVGSNIRQALIGQRQAMNDQIQNAYAQADAQANNAPRVNMKPVVQALQSNRSQFLASQEGGGLLNGIRARMQDFTGGPNAQPGKPLIVDTNGNPLLNEADIPKQMTFSDSERFRQYLNSIYDPDSDINKALIGPIKNAVDAAQDNAGGGQIYQDARTLRQLRSLQFENPSSIQKILATQKGGDYRMADEDIPGFFTSGNGSEMHLKQLINQLNQNPQGQSVVNQLRSNVLQNAVTNATSVVPGESGGGALSGSRLASQFNKIGQGRMNALFTPDQQNYLGALQRGALDLTTAPPIRNPYNPSGTSSQLINTLDYLANNPSQQSAVSRIMNKGASMAPTIGATIGGAAAHGIGAAVGASVGGAIKRGAEKSAEAASQQTAAAQAQAALNPLQSILTQTPAKNNALQQAIARRLMQNAAIAGGAAVPQETH